MSECCEKPENRELVEKRGDLVVTCCKECGRRHFELAVDPLAIGVKTGA